MLKVTRFESATRQANAVGMPILIALIVMFVALAGGCDPTTTWKGSISVDPEVAPTTLGKFLLIIEDDCRYTANDTQGMWGDTADGLHVTWASESWSKKNGYSGAPTYVPERREYTYWHEEINYEPTTVKLGAFVDLNGNEQPDVGEPWGVCPQNPITSMPHDAPPEDAPTFDILIDRRWQ